MESVLNVHRLGVSDVISLSRTYGTSPEINCRPSELAEVFEVLINNAIEAIEHAHGQINIRSGADGNSAWIEVEDNGKGIDPEHLNKLFDPFFTTKKVGAGVGMSLAKAYGIVRKHRGEISVKSQPGKGSTFRVSLPITAALPITSAQTSAESLP